MENKLINLRRLISCLLRMVHWDRQTDDKACNEKRENVSALPSHEKSPWLKGDSHLTGMRRKISCFCDDGHIGKIRQFDGGGEVIVTRNGV